MSRVTIISGPPGGGKSTWVKERCKFGDIVIDLDMIMAAISGQPVYDKPEILLSHVLDIRDRLYDILEDDTDIRHGWIIAGLPKFAERRNLAIRFNADVVIVETDPIECLKRISEDGRRSNKWELWQHLITNWWNDYQRNEGDMIVR